MVIVAGLDLRARQDKPSGIAFFFRAKDSFLYQKFMETKRSFLY